MGRKVNAFMRCLSLLLVVSVCFTVPLLFFRDKTLHLKSAHLRSAILEGYGLPKAADSDRRVECDPLGCCLWVRLLDRLAMHGRSSAHLIGLGTVCRGMCDGNVPDAVTAAVY